MDHHPAIAGNDADGLNGLAPPLGVQELQRDLAGGADMDPVVAFVDPQGGLVYMQGGPGQELFNGGLFPVRQGMVQLHHVLQDGRLRDDPADQCPDRLLHPLQREHLGDQQVQDVGPDPCAVLQRAGHVRRKLTFGLRPAAGALLDLGIHVAHHLFKEEVDAGTPIVSLTGHLAQVFATGPALVDAGNLDGLHRPGVAGQCVIKGNLNKASP